MKHTETTHQLLTPILVRLLLTTCLLSGLSACNQASTPELVGTVERDRIEVKLESSEAITEIHARDGQPVAAGDLLLVQNDERAKARLAQQSAQLEQARARLAELERGPRQESIRESRARLAGAQAERINAAAELQRTRDVFDQGLSSQFLLDRAETRLKTAQASESAAHEALAALLHGTTPEELQQAAAVVAAGEAVVVQAEIELQRTRSLAPSHGIIDKILFQKGERPPPGTTVAVLLDSSRVFARIYVPAELRTHIKPGESLRVQVDGVAQEIQGTVRWVSSDASFTPYFALTEHDRSRLSYLAEVDLTGANDLPSGLPLIVLAPDL